MKAIVILIALALGIASYGQKKIEVTNLYTIFDTATMQLKTGEHRMIVKKTEGRKVSYDTIPITVLADTARAGLNYYPVANAGRDTTIKYGTTGLLKGSARDLDGRIVSWKWTKVKGPRAGRISYSTRQETKTTGQGEGVFIYRLTVTDDKGGVGEDLMTMTVVK